MCSWTRTPIAERSDNYWHLLEVAELRFNHFFFNRFIFLREENESKTVSTSLYCSAPLRTPIG